MNYRGESKQEQVCLTYGGGEEDLVRSLVDEWHGRMSGPSDHVTMHEGFISMHKDASDGWLEFTKTYERLKEL